MTALNRISPPAAPADIRVRTTLLSQQHWLVTGVAGFIGSNLLEALLGLGQRVTGMDNFLTGYRHNLEQVRIAVGDPPVSNCRETTSSG